MDLIDGISDLENFGIDLKLKSSEAEKFYTDALRIWFSTERGYECTAQTDKEFIVSSMEVELATIYIHDSVLRVKPIEKDPYEILMCILEFIAENHRKVVDTYEYLIDKESKWYMNEPSTGKSKEKKVEDCVDEKEEDTEEESDEWI